MSNDDTEYENEKFENVTIYVDFPDPDYGQWSISALAYKNENAEGEDYNLDEASETGRAEKEFEKKSAAVSEAKKLARGVIEMGDAETVTVLVEGNEEFNCGSTKSGKSYCHRSRVARLKK